MPCRSAFLGASLGFSTASFKASLLGGLCYSVLQGGVGGGWALGLSRLERSRREGRHMWPGMSVQKLLVLGPKLLSRPNRHIQFIQSRRARRNSSLFILSSRLPLCRLRGSISRPQAGKVYLSCVLNFQSDSRPCETAGFLGILMVFCGLHSHNSDKPGEDPLKVSARLLEVSSQACLGAHLRVLRGVGDSGVSRCSVFGFYGFAACEKTASWWACLHSRINVMMILPININQPL